MNSQDVISANAAKKPVHALPDKVRTKKYMAKPEQIFKRKNTFRRESLKDELDKYFTSLSGSLPNESQSKIILDAAVTRDMSYMIDG